jgi:hypothetical protein
MNYLALIATTAILLIILAFAAEASSSCTEVRDVSDQAGVHSALMAEEQ